MDDLERENIEFALRFIAKERVFRKMRLGTAEGLEEFHARYLECYDNYRARCSTTGDDVASRFHERMALGDFTEKLKEVFDGCALDDIFSLRIGAVYADFSLSMAELIIVRLVFQSPHFEAVSASIRDGTSNDVEIIGFEEGGA